MGWERQTLDACRCVRFGLVKLAAGFWMLTFYKNIQMLVIYKKVGILF